jgi:outer membrane protein
MNKYWYMMVLMGIICIPCIPASLSQAQSLQNSQLESQPDSTVVQLTLPDVVTLLLQNSRQLKNAALDRIVQKQQLRQAESVFSPQFQPLLGVGVSQALSGSVTGSAPLSSTTVEGSTSGTSDEISPGTNLTRGAQVVGEVRSPLGTRLTVTINPFESQRLGVSVTQPLLRGAGRRVNEAPVNQARLTETRNQLELRKTLIEQITQAGVTYRALAKAQEALRIQQVSLASQQKQLEFVQVLVDVGRRARSELVDVRANIAATESQVLVAQNALEQARSDLLNLLDLDNNLNIAVPQTLIAEFQTGNIPAEAYQNLQTATLLPKAYSNRPEYLQTQLDIKIAELAEVVTRDNQRWGLDLQGTAGVGDTSQVAAGITLTRKFGDQELETNRTQSNVDLQKRQNDLARITKDIELEVSDRLRDINSSLEQITSARQATELTQRRLEIATERFRRGRDGDLFQVISLQNDVVTAQNEEVNAKIGFLDAVARLDQATGVTLETWQSQVEASGLLDVP